MRKAMKKKKFLQIIQDSTAHCAKGGEEGRSLMTSLGLANEDAP